MCNTFSGVTTRPIGTAGPVSYWLELSDSHEDIIAVYNLREGDAGDRLQRWEFVPQYGRYDQIDQYTLRLDNERQDWFTPEVEALVTAEVRTRVLSRIISSAIPVLADRTWILADGASVGRLISGRILAMYGSSRVGILYGSSQVGVLCDSSRVGALNDSSQVGVLCGSSRVGALYGSAQVGVLCDSSQVGELYDSSRVVRDKRSK